MERFESLTAFAESRDGSEDRRRLRAFPYYSFAAQYVYSGADTALIAAVRNSAGAKFLTPVWMHPVEGTGTPAPVLGACFNRDPNPDSSETVPTREVQLYVLRANGLAAIQTYAVTAAGVLKRRTPYVGDVDLFASDCYAAFPVIEAAVDGGFDLEMASRGTFTGQLTFFSQALDEGDAYGGTLVGGLPVLPLPSDGTSSMRQGAAPVRDSWAPRIDSADAGHKRIEHFLFAKRSLSGTWVATNRADALALRAFLLRLHGRANAFWMPDPADPSGALKKWRLTSDSVELRWLTTRAVETTLSMVEVTE